MGCGPSGLLQTAKGVKDPIPIPQKNRHSPLGDRTLDRDDTITNMTGYFMDRSENSEQSQDVQGQQTHSIDIEDNMEATLLLEDSRQFMLAPQNNVSAGMTQANCNYLNDVNEDDEDIIQHHRSIRNRNSGSYSELLDRIISPEDPATVRSLLNDIAMALSTAATVGSGSSRLCMTNAAGEQDDDYQQQPLMMGQRANTMPMLLRDSGEGGYISTDNSDSIYNQWSSNGGAFNQADMSPFQATNNMISSRRITNRHTPDILRHNSEESQVVEISDSVIGNSNPLLGIRGMGDDKYTRDIN